MARDYKHAAAKRRGKAAGAPPWLSFVTGLAIGLFVAYVVFLQRAGPPPVDEGPGVARADAHAGAQTSAPAPQPAPESPEPEAGLAPPHKPRFDFYTILPEMEVKVPDWQLVNTTPGAAPALEPGAYVLQVGSFQHFEEADRAKANLALRGFSAEIQPVQLNGQDTWYRVRIGPFRDLGEVQAMRGRLTENGMDFMLLKIKEGAGN
jgi:cell division protein FtsN